jgi:AraC-like DNA-binding protein
MRANICYLHHHSCQMYKEIAPAAELAHYIDAYWISETGSDYKSSIVRILPDTCTDIVLNLGADIYSHGSADAQLKSGNTYLLGTMTSFADVNQPADTLTYGVRFKPFALNALLGFSLSGTANKRLELGIADFNFTNFISSGQLNIEKLNAFFIQRLPKNKHLLGLFHTIQQTGGRISLPELAQKHHLSERQLERVFSDKAGVTIKELCNQVRMIHAVKVLKSRKADESLLSVSMATGFYDHAHLTKSLKKYTGYTPTDFLK